MKPEALTLLVTKMLGQGNTISINKLNLPECIKTNNIGFAAPDLQNLTIISLGANLVTSTKPSQPCRQSDS